MTYTLQRTQLAEWSSTNSNFKYLNFNNCAEYCFCIKPIPNAIFRLHCIINNDDKYLLFNASHPLAPVRFTHSEPARSTK